MKKCANCKVPLEGLGYKLIAKPFFKIFPSKKKEGLCNKCDKE